MAGPATWSEFITQINAILDNFALTVGEDVVSSNVADTTDFTKGNGAYVNTPSNPWTSDIIPLVDIGAVRGGFSGIWYRGPVLDADSFTGGTVTMFSGVNVENELCRVFIDYDLTSETFSVTIQVGYTGDITNPPVGDTTPPAKMTITAQEDSGGDLVAPTKMTITGVQNSDGSAPTKMTITSIT